MGWIFEMVSYSMIPLALALVILGSLAGVWVVIDMASRVSVGAVVIAISFVISAVFISSPSISIGINLSVDDLAFLLLLSALAVRVAMNGSLGAYEGRGPWISLGIVFLISSGIGLMQYGSSAGVEARSNFYFLTAGLYFFSFSYSERVLHDLWRIAKGIAWLIVALALYRLIGAKFGLISSEVISLAGAGSEFRVIGSSPTLFLLLVGLGYFLQWMQDERRSMFLSAMVMFLLVIILQHRSVWVAALGGLGVILWYERQALAKRSFLLSTALILVISAVTMLVLLNPDNRVIETLSKSAISATASEGTHMDRLLGWQVLLSDFIKGSPLEWALGKPYGTGYARWVQGDFKAYSPHNFYVQLLLRLGFVGLVAFLWIHYKMQKRIRDAISADQPKRSLHVFFFAALVVNLIYYIPYQGFYLQGALCGVIIGYFFPSYPKGNRALGSIYKVGRVRK
jgi:O-antigen ligase